MQTLTLLDPNAQNTRSLGYFLLVTCCLLGIGAGVLSMVFLLP